MSDVAQRVDNCIQAWWPEFDPQDSQGRRKERTPTDFSLTSSQCGGLHAPPKYKHTKQVHKNIVKTF